MDPSANSLQETPKLIRERPSAGRLSGVDRGPTSGFVHRCGSGRSVHGDVRVELAVSGLVPKVAEGHLRALQAGSVDDAAFKVRAFRRSGREQLAALVNAHVQAVAPGVSRFGQLPC